ncbi:MAG: AI-2E family transporter [Stomatobaculum sp.]|nr:AI-2E family transporter [Stomatobaculum sp.]
MMFKERHRERIAWGLTAFSVIAASLVVYFIMHNFTGVKEFLLKIIDILMPIIYGCVMAFLMTPLFERVRALIVPLKDRGKNKTADVLSRFAATLFCIILILAFLTALISMVIPQLISGFMELYGRIPDSVNSVETLIESMFRDNPEGRDTALRYYTQFYKTFMSWVNTNVLPNINKYLTGITSGVKKLVGVLGSFFIGIIVMAYLLNMKKRLASQCKRAAYAFLPLATANSLVEEMRFIANVFSKFIVGKIIDSAIVGVICYIAMALLKMPYALVISVIVAVTNIIPFFGPFIGAIPSILILLMVKPVSALQFAVLILLLQQLDGNIIGPKILGSTTGVSSFWVLFSILFFGGIWGIVGMIIGIPTFAVISRQFTKMVLRRLDKKNLPEDPMIYRELDHIDVETGLPVSKSSLHSGKK